MNWDGKNNYACPHICLILRVLLHMRNCKASGSLTVPLWPSAPFWPMICPDGGRFASFIVDWMELLTLKEAYIPGSCNSVFGNENLKFRMIALRVHFDCYVSLFFPQCTVFLVGLFFFLLSL